MPIFKFNIIRTLEFTEGMVRIYTAGTLEEAQQLADAEALEFDEDCPDDCSEIESAGMETSDFIAREIEIYTG